MQLFRCAWLRFFQTLTSSCRTVLRCAQTVMFSSVAFIGADADPRSYRGVWGLAGLLCVLALWGCTAIPSLLRETDCGQGGGYKPVDADEGEDEVHERRGAE